MSTEREAIILHPGSSYLYVGFATDSTPQAVPHLIAYEQTQSRDQGDKDQESEDGLSNDNPSLVLQYKTKITVRKIRS